MGGEVSHYLSSALDMGSAFGVIEICELTETQVRIKKEIGGGRKAEVVLKLPSILCVQSGILPLRYLSAMKRQKARSHPIKLLGKLETEEVKQAISGMTSYEIREVSLPSQEGHAEMIKGDRSEMASKLLDLISSMV